jgi:hypothetical protein
MDDNSSDRGQGRIRRRAKYRFLERDQGSKNRVGMTFSESASGSKNRREDGKGKKASRLWPRLKEQTYVPRHVTNISPFLTLVRNGNKARRNRAGGVLDRSGNPGFAIKRSVVISISCGKYFKFISQEPGSLLVHSISIPRKTGGLKRFTPHFSPLART